MKSKLLALSLAIFAIALVSAQVMESNSFLYGILEQDGSLTQTSTVVNGVNVLGVICSSPQCATVSGEGLFPGQPLFTSTNQITLTYPTTLQSANGYGVYMYKEGYIPFEVAANWSGTGSVGPYSNYLSKKAVCIVPLSNIQITPGINQVQTSARVESPINHGGPLSYVPPIIANQYTVDVNVTVIAQQIGGGTVQNTQIITVPYSDSRTATSTLQLAAGTYNISIIASAADNVCISNQIRMQSSTVTVQGPAGNQTNVTNMTDTTAPGSVTNLALKNKGTTFITWNWTNPTDPDFSAVRIYLNGAFIGTSSSTMYNATGLAPNTTYTITLNTVDTSGNVNLLNISNTQTTNPINATINDTTAPSPVSGLHSTDITRNSITWAWVNPTDPDFSHVIIYLDGVFVRTLSGTSFTANNFGPRESHTITLNTVDTSGNVNLLNISNTAQTLPPRDTRESDGSNSGKKKKTFASYAPIATNKTIPPVFEDEPLPAIQKKAKSNNLWIVLMLFIGITLLLVLILLLALLKG